MGQVCSQLDFSFVLNCQHCFRYNHPESRGNFTMMNSKKISPKVTTIVFSVIKMSSFHYFVTGIALASKSTAFSAIPNI